jgi:hypothetical protein
MTAWMAEKEGGSERGRKKGCLESLSGSADVWQNSQPPRSLGRGRKKGKNIAEARRQTEISLLYLEA